MSSGRPLGLDPVYARNFQFPPQHGTQLGEPHGGRGWKNSMEISSGHWRQTLLSLCQGKLVDSTDREVKGDRCSSELVEASCWKTEESINPRAERVELRASQKSFLGSEKHKQHELPPGQPGREFSHVRGLASQSRSSRHFLLPSLFCPCPLLTFLLVFAAWHTWDSGLGTSQQDILSALPNLRQVWGLRHWPFPWVPASSSLALVWPCAQGEMR